MGYELLCDFIGFHYLLMREIAIAFLNEVNLETSLFISSYGESLTVYKNFRV